MGHAPSSRSTLPRPTLALLGLRASGKTTVGRLLAEELGRAFLDLDDLTVEAAGRAGREVERALGAGELLARVGEPAFRGFEAEALRRVLEPGLAVVLATGGGVLGRSDNRSWLERAAFCVWLRVPIAVLEERLKRDATPRPALLGRDTVQEVAALGRRRDPLYAAAADLEIDAAEGDAAEVCARVLRELP